MAKYTVRITNDENGIIAWIDQDGLKCIMQPNLPGETEGWKTESEALSWANSHAADLEAQYEASILAAQQAEEKRVKELEALQAQIDTAAALKTQNEALLALVASLTAQNNTAS